MCMAAHAPTPQDRPGQELRPGQHAAGLCSVRARRSFQGAGAMRGQRLDGVLPTALE
ncbi:hypothetical protein PF004_g27328, partial [Phytophthora fragariae]